MSDKQDIQPKENWRSGVRELFKLDLGSFFSLENIQANLAFILFLVLLAMIYIGNRHMAENAVRDIDRLKGELKEKRWEYMSGKADLMYKSKQTEVAEAVHKLGLKEIIEPPKKIVITEGEY